MYTIHVSDAVPVTSGEYCNLEISATTKSCGSKGTVTIWPWQEQTKTKQNRKKTGILLMPPQVYLNWEFKKKGKSLPFALRVNNSLRRVTINIQRFQQKIVHAVTECEWDEQGHRTMEEGLDLLSSASYSEHTSMLASFGKEGGGAGLEKHHSYPWGRCNVLFSLFIFLF